MKFSKAVLYAIQAVTHLAANSDKGVPVRCAAIAKHARIPRKYLAVVLGKLVAHQILISCRGSRGGYALARSPDSIKLLEVIEAVNGPIGWDWPAGCLDSDSPPALCLPLELLRRTNGNTAVLELERPAFGLSPNLLSPSSPKRSGPLNRLTDTLRATLADVTIGQLIAPRPTANSKAVTA